MTTVKLPPNIQEFNEITAVIFAQLYSEHPLTKDLDIDEVAKVLGRSGTETLPSGRNFKDVFAHTLSWLIYQGYVYSNGSLPRERVQLTDKALFAMNVVPPSLNKSRGAELVEASKSASSASGREWVGQIISSITEGFTKGMIGGG
jgi:hypothetical protein